MRRAGVSEDTPVVDVVFNMSAAASLRHALDKLGRRARMIGCPDDPSFGPVNPRGVARRAERVKTEFGYEPEFGHADCQETGLMAERFWRDVLASRMTTTAWIGRRCSAEYAAFLEFIFRMEGERGFVVDASDVESRRLDSAAPFVANGFGVVPPQRIIEAGLCDRGASLQDDVRNRYLAQWGRLQSENSAFLIVGPFKFEFAPIAHFDNLLVESAGDDWRKAAHVVGTALANFLDGPYWQVGYFARRAQTPFSCPEGYFGGSGWHAGHA